MKSNTTKVDIKEFSKTVRSVNINKYLLGEEPKKFDSLMVKCIFSDDDSITGSEWRLLKHTQKLYKELSRSRMSPAILDKEEMRYLDKFLKGKVGYLELAFIFDMYEVYRYQMNGEFHERTSTSLEDTLNIYSKLLDLLYQAL